jgi:hypothetical protein
MRRTTSEIVAEILSKQVLPVRLVLAGGGDAADSAPLDQAFAAWTAGGSILYWPFASPAPHDTNLRWFESTYGPWGFASR